KKAATHVQGANDNLRRCSPCAKGNTTASSRSSSSGLEAHADIHSALVQQASQAGFTTCTLTWRLIFLFGLEDVVHQRRGEDLYQIYSHWKEG
ncbi:hypothetical protein VIGAN_03166900, partial [Vigna angularis var. angularis]